MADRYDSLSTPNYPAIAFAPITGVTAPDNQYPDEEETDIVIPMHITSFNLPQAKTAVGTVDLMPIINPHTGEAFGGKTLTHAPRELTKFTVEGFIDTPCAGRNLQLNPSFESGVTGYANDAGTVTQSADVAHAGTYSAKVTRTSAGNGYVDCYDNRTSGDYWPDCTPGKEYTSSLWVRPTTTRDCYIQVQWRDPGYIAQNSSATISCPANTWTKLSVTGTAPEGATVFLPLLYALGLNQNEVVYTDDWWVEESTQFNIPQVLLDDKNLTYVDLISMLDSGQMSIGTDGTWNRVRPLWFRDPYGRVYNNPRILDFSGSYIEQAPGRNNFTMVMKV